MSGCELFGCTDDEDEAVGPGDAAEGDAGDGFEVFPRCLGHDEAIGAGYGKEWLDRAARDARGAEIDDDDGWGGVLRVQGRKANEMGTAKESLRSQGRHKGGGVSDEGARKDWPRTCQSRKVPRRATGRAIIFHTHPKSWCTYCAKGHAIVDAHKKTGGARPEKIHRIGMGLCFLCQRGEEQIVVKDDTSKHVFAHVVLCKDVVGSRKSRYVVSRVIADIKPLGCKKVIVVGGQEPSLKALHEEIRHESVIRHWFRTAPWSRWRAADPWRRRCKMWKVRFEPSSSLCDHIERRIMAIEGMVAWLVEHGADCINRCKEGKDGQTARQRVLGRRD